MITIYENCSNWEKDFITKELLSDNKTIYIEKYNKSVINSIDSNIIDNNIFVFTSNVHNYNEILDMVLYLKPKIIIHLSDEWGTKPEFQKLANHTKLLIRQHYHSSYNYDNPNIIYMPLGYMVNMFENTSTELLLKTPDERKYKWSFVGNQDKTDRKLMINTFKSLEPNFCGTASVTEMRDIYMNSIFTPNGRGNVKLDCFRLYEASACGSIPIVVGSQKEILETFKHEENPPWIFAETWQEAFDKTKTLLTCPNLLYYLQKDLINWWKNRVMNLKTKINNIK